ncbi:hypothetical protein ACFX13_035297 [Malus domestica]
MDNLIFEARKNLEAVVDGVVLSNEVAKLEAIIEGLNKALTLDLEAVTFFCDDYRIYQYNYLRPGDVVITFHDAHQVLVDFGTSYIGKFFVEATRRFHNADWVTVREGESDFVKQHQKGDSMWTVLKGCVYKLSPYMRFHPGGMYIV